MRLLNTTTLKLKEFWDDQIPSYAILSHTWEQDEITLQELEHPSDTTSTKQGYLKIVRCTEISKEAGHEWVWIDTCCIDKTSSAEISEAIKSMFRWYQEADICFVYLSDYDSGSVDEDDVAFRECRWFTRGWTLQELIAPKQVIFYDRAWQSFGTKNDLAGSISSVTGVDLSMLIGVDINDYSLAQRMSWAACRRTIRREDIAYCLLGIFDIQMPLLYGEGYKAFLRLQEIISTRSSDLTLFA